MEGKEIDIDNDLKPLQFYSIEDGDKVLVRWSWPENEDQRLGKMSTFDLG